MHPTCLKKKNVVLHLLPAFLLLVLPPQLSAQRFSRTETDARIIAADLAGKSEPLNQMFRVCVGAGRANEGLRGDWQRQLKLCHDELGFEFIRFHGLFCDDMGVYSEDAKGNVHYNWQNVDALYDQILATGMRPFVELSFMPSALASGSKTVFWWRGNVTPPKSLDRWSDFMRAVAEHLTERSARTK